MSAGKIAKQLSSEPAWIVFTLASVAYVLLIVPGVLWMDVGELAAAAFHLGGAHPPGHPGHSLLGKLASFIPVGEVATRLSLLSALAAGAFLAGLTQLMLTVFPGQRLLAILAIVPMALTPALLINATRPEVYTPCFALLTWALVDGCRFLQSATPRSRDALRSVFLLALAAGFHPAITLVVALPLAIAMLARIGKRSIRLVPWAIALTAVGALLYLYLPTRALASDPPPLVWGDPSSLTGLFDLVSATVYQDNFAFGDVLHNLADRYSLLTEGPGFILCLVGYGGLAFGALTGLRTAGLLLVLAVLIPISGALQSSFNPDMSAYLAMTMVPLSIGLAIVAVALSKALPSSLFPKEELHWASAVAIAPVLIFALLAEASERQELDDSDDAMQLWDETVGRMPPGPGVFFASGDHLLFVAQYEALVAGARPDIVIASPELVRDRWFLEHLRSQLPASDLYLPFLDDGHKGQIAERLYWENVQRGRPVWADAQKPPPAHVVADRRAYRFLASAPPVATEPAPPPPLAFSGYVGRRVAGLVALQRGQYEANRGQFARAAQALDIVERFSAESLQGPAIRPALLPHLPGVTRRFLYDDFERDLLADDIAFQLGFDTLELGGSTVEQQIHFAWRLLLSGDIERGNAAIAAIGMVAEASTTPMLVAIGKSDLAEARLRSALRDDPDDARQLSMLASLLANTHQPAALAEARELFTRATELDPGNDEAWVRLGVVCAQLGQDDEARAAWNKALQLAPTRQDARSYLQRLDSK